MGCMCRINSAMLGLATEADLASLTLICGAEQLYIRLYMILLYTQTQRSC